MLFEWWERYRRLILLVAASLFLCSSIWWYMADQTGQQDALSAPLSPVVPVQPEEKPAASPAPSASEQSAAREQKADSQPDPPHAPIYVDVKGSVVAPGVYTFDRSSRVADAIERAGGPLPTADLEQINLAQPLQDGSAVVIPAKRDPADSDTPNHPPLAVQPALQTGLLGGQADETININTATKEELMKLPGIGEAKAQAIIEYREQKQRFRSPEELKQISGIGDKMYERIHDQVRVQ
ncbi:helix-hairpin-helix domain-containing protein [Brevibacillus sp. TJ4]|uniref:helix-hairpin-helix domain-containing protein n=1 Tax=Brevibacillus sp. TJ4 TaxID=3234853 RepID=UPI0037D5C75F